MHHAERIMDAVVTTVTGLATTGSNVGRDRLYPLDGETITSALDVRMGGDTLLDDDVQSLNVLESRLAVYVDVYAKGTGQLSSTLNQVREEVTIALAADYTLGLPFVIDAEEGPASEPDYDASGDQPAAYQRLVWQVWYRRSRLDPGSL